MKRLCAVLGTLLVTAMLVGCVNPTSTPTLLTPTGEVAANVLRVVDGDTIDVATGGTTYRVRYIGMDTPETVHPTVGVECFGYEATEFNRTLVEGKMVYLEKDVSETDRYGRLLRYVWLADGRMVNEVLVRDGYAEVATFPPDVRYVDRFLETQRQAMAAGAGLWGKCTTGNVVPLAPGGTQCDPSYPTVCIPPPPPDLDCGEIPYKKFRVVPPDPHRFDGDKNGVGCQS